ncbi:MAG: HRDC domain-containing protein [Acidobacteriota bacterium]
MNERTLMDDPARVSEIVAALRRAGSFALDLEFVSESRYIPELSLVQVGWGDPDSPAVAAIDPLAVDVEPVAQLLADPEVEKVLHAAQADLALLGQRFAVAGRNVFDTQIAAAYLGIGDQIGYGNLVQKVLGVTLDKGAQFTQWSRRPLDDEQIRYALDDVRYLPEIRRRLGEQLDARRRMAWVREESQRLAAANAERPKPEEIYRKIKGWDRMAPRSQGVVRVLAAWRERRALAGNKPPQWVLQDRVLLEIARRPPKKLADFERVRGIKEGFVRRHGRELLERVREGLAHPLEPSPRPPALSDEQKVQSSMVSAIVQAMSREAGVAPRFVASRDEVEALVRWWGSGDRELASAPELGILTGWRRQLAGQPVLDWLAGRTSIVAAADGIELRTVESPQGQR